MAQNKGESAPDRLDTPGLRWWKAGPVLSELELAVIARDCEHAIAKAHGFSDDPGRQAAARHNQLLGAIRNANVRSLAETGAGISTVDEYERWKLAGDPGRRVIYQVFRSWQAAKNEAGIGRVPRPGTSLLRTKGARNRKGPGIQWSFDDRVRALATCRESGFPGAMRPSTRAYREWRDSWPEVVPDYITVIGQIVVEKADGEKGKVKEFGFPQMNRFAEELALREPDSFPRLAAYAQTANQVADAGHTTHLRGPGGGAV